MAITIRTLILLAFKINYNVYYELFCCSEIALCLVLFFYLTHYSVLTSDVTIIESKSKIANLTRN